MGSYGTFKSIDLPVEARIGVSQPAFNVRDNRFTGTPLEQSPPQKVT